MAIERRVAARMVAESMVSIIITIVVYDDVWSSCTCCWLEEESPHLVRCDAFSFLTVQLFLAKGLN